MCSFMFNVWFSISWFTFESDFFVGSGLLVRATYLVCHRLISSWKSDLIVSLAALELLAGLARLHNTRAGK